jgi:hypothetical protein
MAYSFRYVAVGQQSIPLWRRSNQNRSESAKAAQAKELVDNSQLNDTIIAHIDSAVGRASQNSLCPAPAPPQKVMQPPACIGVKVLK